MESFWGARWKQKEKKEKVVFERKFKVIRNRRITLNLKLMQKSILKVLILSLFYFSSCSKDENSQSTDCDLINPSTTISGDEIEMLKFMREEEKLAYDVYRYLYDKYGINVFNNISNSEKQHMDKVLCLLNYYHIQDPASSQSGVFNNLDLQNLYNQLIAQGDISLVEALKVGATIEDVDIKDLMELSSETSNPAILDIFENLTCGSRNHMRAFVSSINTNEETYTPQFISQELFNQIITSSKEQCN